MGPGVMENSLEKLNFPEWVRHAQKSRILLGVKLKQKMKEGSDKNIGEL